MIKLFRNIRKSLLNEGKTSKYLKYAIGEIVLVVIGILIALQINNWNEKRKNNELKVFYMNSLVNDLIKDTIDINRVAKWQKTEVNKLDTFKERINHKDCTLDTIIKIVKHEFNIIYHVKRGYRNGTFNTIISSGNIELLDKDLVKHLMELQNYQTEEIKRSTNNLDHYNLKVNDLEERYPPITDNNLKESIVNRTLWSTIDENYLIGKSISMIDNKHFALKNTYMSQNRIKQKSTEILVLLNQLLDNEQ